MAKKKITVRQAIDFCKAFDTLKDSGIVFKGLSLIDLADNNVLIRPLVTAWEKANEVPSKYREYGEAIEEARLTSAVPVTGKAPANKGSNDFPIDGAVFGPALAELRKKYASTIKAYTDHQEAQMALLDKEREIDIIEIGRDQITIDEENNNAAGVLSGLMVVFSARK
jgi:hypothetical protein